MSANRHLARIAAFQALFILENKAVANWKETTEYCAKEFNPRLENLDFSLSLVEGVLKFEEELKRLIGENAPDWPVDKIAPIDRTALKLGIYEILHVDEVPPIVSVNEAIELAKKFGDTNSGRFINGVLSAVLQKHCPEAKKKMMQKTEKKS